MRENTAPDEVRAVMTRYGAALDERDWERLETCFTADATAVIPMSPAPLEGPAQIAEFCERALSGFAHTQHLLGYPDVAVDGAAATCRCPVRATHVAADGTLFTVGGTYREELALTAEGWRIRRHDLSVEYMS